jgi:hypothetical protein
MRHKTVTRYLKPSCREDFIKFETKPVTSCDKETTAKRHFRRSGRGDRIRTCDPLVPNQMRYQAALLPDMGSLVQQCTSRWPASRSPERAKAGGPGGTRTPDLAVMSGQL